MEEKDPKLTRHDVHEIQDLESREEIQDSFDEKEEVEPIIKERVKVVEKKFKAKPKTKVKTKVQKEKVYVEDDEPHLGMLAILGIVIITILLSLAIFVWLSKRWLLTTFPESTIEEVLYVVAHYNELITQQDLLNYFLSVCPALLFLFIIPMIFGTRIGKKAYILILFLMILLAFYILFTSWNDLDMHYHIYEYIQTH